MFVHRLVSTDTLVRQDPFELSLDAVCQLMNNNLAPCYVDLVGGHAWPTKGL